MEARPAELKSDESRASLGTDLLVFVYSHTKTGYQAHVVLLIALLWKIHGEKLKYTENNNLWNFA